MKKFFGFLILVLTLAACSTASNNTTVPLNIQLDSPTNGEITRDGRFVFSGTTTGAVRLDLFIDGQLYNTFYSSDWEYVWYPSRVNQTIELSMVASSQDGTHVQATSYVKVVEGGCKIFEVGEIIGRTGITLLRGWDNITPSPEDAVAWADTSYTSWLLTGTPPLDHSYLRLSTNWVGNKRITSIVLDNTGTPWLPPDQPTFTTQESPLYCHDGIHRGNIEILGEKYTVLVY